MTATDREVANSFVVLRLAKRRFALPAGIVEELAPSLRLHHFPHGSPSIAGVIVRRGRIVPVLDVAPLLVGKSVSAQHFYLIAHCKIDQVTELSAIPVNGECELAAGDMQPPVDRPPYVAGTLQVADESLDVLDLEALVTSNVARSRESSGAEAQP